MNVVSLFSGIGGLDHGLARAGFQHLLLCEGGGDPNGTKAEREQWKSGEWRRGVLRARFPGVPVYDDVRSVGAADVRLADRRGDGQDVGRGQVEDLDGGSSGADEGVAFGGDAGRMDPIDLLCGGFPCQDLSVAGKRAGLAGARSGLFFEYARIVDAFRPRWLLVENVPGLLSSNGGRDFGVVLGTLADLGYGLAWRVLDSRFFGVPQRRRRVFVVGALVVGDPRAAAERAGQILAVGSRCSRHPATRGEAEQGAAHILADGSGSRVARTLGSLSHGGYRTTDLDGVPAFVSENQRSEVLETPYARQLTSGGGKPGQGYPMIREQASVRRLTPVECERLQALPDGWTDPNGDAPDSRRYAALGDAVTASVGEWIGRRIIAVDG